MPVETGFVLPGARSLAELCAPLAVELTRCHWLIDLYSGPFDIVWTFESAANEALVDRSMWDVPGTADTSTRGLRPGSLPGLADRLIFDEQSFYFAIDAADEHEALRRTAGLVGHVGDFSVPFLRRLDELADLFLFHFDGWWEIYCGRPDWRRRLRAAWPDLSERPLAQARTPPGGRR